MIIEANKRNRKSIRNDDMMTKASLQYHIYKGLLSKDAYPHRVSSIQTDTTHISWIFLAGPYAYKIKKQVKFGRVLDFSTLWLRRKYCYREVELNRKLCRDMYLGVVRIVTISGSDGNRVAIANTHTKTGRVVEYAVKMKRIDLEYRMDRLLTARRIRLENIRKIASILSSFHSRALTNKKIQRYGRSKYLTYKIKENFQTLAKLKYPAPSAESKLIKFVDSNENFLLNRIRDKKIRDIHGDLYLKNIFIIKNRKYYLYDRVEFNDSLRYADVAEDVAHLSMDLEYHKRKDLQLHFVQTYISTSKDKDLKKVLNFLICYKAFVRAKVSLFQASFESANARKSKLIKEAEAHLALGGKYLRYF
jgi:aminoglycoside phosphotransferase family enzyme